MEQGHLGIFVDYDADHIDGKQEHLRQIQGQNRLFEFLFPAVHIFKDQKNEVDNPMVLKTVMKKMGGYFGESIRFLIDNRKATKLMFANSFVGAIDILLLFFLQSKLNTAGISNRLLGLALFIMQIGGVIGAKLILKAKNVKYAKILDIFKKKIAKRQCVIV